MFCPVCRSEYADDWKVCPRDAATLLLSQFIGKYRIDQLLGAGGMGAVYRAYNPDTSSSVAIKILHGGSAGNDASRQRFQREANSVAALKTQHVVSIYDFGADQTGMLYLVMEYLEGHSLRDEITPMPNSMPLPRVNFVVDQALRGLAAAHKAAIVHRDLKPENLFIADTDDGEVVKVLDFGIARMQRGDTPNLTNSGALMGTPAYMAPEQVAGNRGMVGRHSDVYAMGVIIYELCTGMSPFHGDTLSEVLSNILSRQFKSLRELRPDLPPAIIDLVDAALAEDPAKRFGSAHDLREAWLKAWAQLPSEIRYAPVPESIKREPKEGDRAPDIGMATDIPSAATQLPRPAVGAMATPTPTPSSHSPATTDLRGGGNASFDDRRSVTPGPVVVDTRSEPAKKSKAWLFAVAGLVAVGLAVGIVMMSGGSGDKDKNDKTDKNDDRVVNNPPAIDAGTTVAHVTPDAQVAPPAAPDAAPPAVVPAGMVLIAGKTFEAGTPKAMAKQNPSYARPLQQVTVASFYLDITEVAAPDGRPLVGLTFAQAKAKCEEAGKRLPTSDEWELAARDGTLDPKQAALKSATRTTPEAVKSHPADMTQSGVYDLLGNVSEWTATPWPKKKGAMVVRGSGVAFAPTAGFLASIHARFDQPANKGDPVIGFRCAQDVPAK